MGGGRWDNDKYVHDTTTRRSRGIDDFHYSKTADAIHANLDPHRINKKPFGKLESRDSTEHPESNAIFVGFDVTGSNIARAREAQLKLPNLMDLLTRYIKDPQIAFAANDDFKVQPDKCTQISDFESDNRIDEHLRNIILVGDGGGNSGESYDLLLYAAARKTVLDCMEKRGKKGYLFLYADEPLMTHVSKVEVKHTFDDDLERDIPIEEIIEEARRLYNVYLISTVRPEYDAQKQYLELFGEESVLTLQHPSMICELIGSVIGLNEDAKPDKVVKDLEEVGLSSKDARSVTTTALATAKHGAMAKTGTLPPASKTGASRL